MHWLQLSDVEDHTGGRQITIALPAGVSVNAPLIEAINTVHQIADTHPAPYTLMLSGGIDSQAMLWAWIQSGVPFKAVSVTYDDFNSHDLETLDQFITQHALYFPIVRHNLDIISFLENELPTYSKKYDCSSPQICTHMKMCEFIPDGTIIFSGNYVSTPNNAGPSLSYAILGLARYAELNSRSLVPFFFLHTQALAYSFIDLVDATILNSYMSKIDCYTKAGFPIVRQETKYTGFERIKDHYDQFSNLVSIKQRIRFASKPSKRVFDLLFRYPFEQLINDPTVIYRYDFLDNKDNT